MSHPIADKVRADVEHLNRTLYAAAEQGLIVEFVLTPYTYPCKHNKLRELKITQEV